MNELNRALCNLRFLPAQEMNQYLALRHDDLSLVKALGLPLIKKFEKDVIVVHSWLPGHICLSSGDTSRLKRSFNNDSDPQFIKNTVPGEWLATEKATVDIDMLLKKVVVDRLLDLFIYHTHGNALDKPKAIELGDILENTAKKLPIFFAMQNRFELKKFLESIHSMNLKTVVEIGTAGGGVLYCLCQLADQSALIVSIDCPDDPQEEMDHDFEPRLYAGFGQPGQRLEFIRTSSHLESTKTELIKKLCGRQIDLLFIDGDHSLGGVKTDFTMYIDLVKPKGIIAFHDIGIQPESWGAGCDVKMFWDEIKLTHDYKEFIDPDGLLNPEELKCSTRPLCFGIGIIKK